MFDLMKFQQDALDNAMVLREFGLSTPRQNGLTETGLHVAIQAAAAKGQRVLHLSYSRLTAREAQNRTEMLIVRHYDGALHKSYRSYDRTEIEFPHQGSVIYFRGYGSRRDVVVDRVIFDDYEDGREVPLSQEEYPPFRPPAHKLWLGQGLKGDGVPVTYFGADHWEDYTDKEVWRRVNPAAGKLFPDKFFENQLAALRPEDFKRELLNIRVQR